LSPSAQQTGGFNAAWALPVLKQAYNLFNAFIALPTALATLVDTPPRDWLKITSSVTSKAGRFAGKLSGQQLF
jgi:hypothetical protein